MRRRRFLINLLTHPLILLLSIILGGLISWGLPETTQYVRYVGELYTRLVVLVTIPYLLVSIISGSTILIQHKNFKGLLSGLVKWYVLLFFIYWLLGVGLSLILKAGFGLTIPAVTGSIKEFAPLFVVKQFFNTMIPNKLIDVLANGKSITLYALLIGLSITLLKREDIRKSITVLDSIYQILYKLTQGVFLFLPIGLFSFAATVYPTLDLDLIQDYLALILPLAITAVVLIVVISIYFWKRSKQVYRAVLREYLRVLFYTLFTPQSLLISPLYSHFLIHKLKFERDSSDFSIPVSLIFYRFGSVLFISFMAVTVMQLGGITIGLDVLLWLLLWTFFISLFSAGLSEVVIIPMLALVLNQLGIMNREVLHLLISLEFISIPLRIVINSSSAMFVSAALSKPKTFLEDDFVHGVLLQNLPENVNLRRYFSDYEGELPVIGIEVTDFILSVFPYALIKEYKSWDEIDDSWSSYDINIVVGDREELKDLVENKKIESKLVALNRRHQ